MSAAETDTVPDDHTPEPGRLLTRVPGRARPQKQALREFEEGVAQLRQQYDPVFWPLFVPEAKNMFRWRVQLECGCTHEVYTHGEDRYPDDRRYLDRFTRGRFPAGEYWCSTKHEPAQKPYRDIVEWVDRKVTEFPADPVEPEYDWMDAEDWAKIRKPKPHPSAFWRVKLSCGHYEQVCTDVDWKPEDGPKLVSEERIVEIRRDFEESWAAADNPGWPEKGFERDHIRKMIDLRWPRPEPERDCFTCTQVRRITGYQRIGWLVTRTRSAPRPSTNLDREKIEARLAAAEAEVRRLRKQLDNPDNA
ncbi:hypothetical protein ACFUTU_07025 [Arthrobacter sp. NPDC057388]|uniref:hypothetical protein n=1 Tax=Arthrobacter sp. NPDC057388 TaxID=3346116 RepID=UPI003643D11D